MGSASGPYDARGLDADRDGTPEPLNQTENRASDTVLTTAATKRLTVFSPMARMTGTSMTQAARSTIFCQETGGRRYP